MEEMNNNYPNQLVTGVSFGITSGVITALGMIVGLHQATSSRLAVFAGIVDDNLFHIYRGLRFYTDFCRPDFDL